MKDKFTLAAGILRKPLIGVFSIWLLLIVFGILQNPNFSLLNTTPLIVIIAVTFSVLVIAIFKIPKIQQGWRFLFITHKWWSVFVITVLCLAWQFFIVTQLITPIGFDVQFIHGALQHPQSAETAWYFKYNPNNLFLVFFQKTLLNFFHATPTWHNLGILSFCCVVGSFIFNTLSIYFLKPQHTIATVYLQNLLLVFFPMVIVPYSDTMVMPLVSFYLLGFILLKVRHSFSIQFLGCLCLALGLTGAYLMKPSAIVPFIAIMISELLLAFDHIFRIQRLPHLKSILLLFIFLGITIPLTLQYQHFANTQHFITYAKGYEEPPIHFISMGMSNGGGFNQEEVIRNQQLKTVKERSRYSQKLIKQRLKHFGFWGYLKFLLLKNQNNTSDGTFGWNKEGRFILAKPTNLIKAFFYPGGKYLSDYYWFAQLFWLVFSLILLLGVNYIDEFSQVFRLAIIGGLSFLLLFEGGRSRYLIQFLPVFLLLFGLVAETAFAKIKESMAVFKKD
ncbi:MAG: hypothetical protein ABF765_07705 [Liquorilactobacillus satsumensis]|uniref:hypothetical protein n=1 Tax=Liquorilactobacillus satsumensis TaxID=259059 RepID=UPI0039E95B44